MTTANIAKVEKADTKATYIPMDDYKSRDYKPFKISLPDGNVIGRKKPFCNVCKDYYKKINKLGLTKEPFMPRCYGDVQKSLPSMESLGMAPDEQDTYNEMAVINDPMKWAEVFFDWKPRWYQKEMLGCTSQFKVVRAGRRLGKALSVDTLIPTPDGWKTMIDLQVGDKVFGSNGLPRNILAVEEEKLGERCYRVSFSDGSSITTDAEHLWLVDTKKSRKARGRTKMPQSQPVTITTEEMLEDLYVGTGKVEANYSIEVASPICYPTKDLLIDPYLLGAWLGDGSSQGGVIYSADPGIIEEIEKRGYTTHDIPSASAGCGLANAYRVEDLTHDLSKLGLCKTKKEKSREKYIPRTYLESSISQREDLLCGLMDTDGSIVCRKSGGTEFSVVSERLAHGVWELIKSLGYKATIRKDPAILEGIQHGWRYRIFFTPWRPVFKLQRKLELQKLRSAPSARQRCRYITEIKRTENVLVKCISVDDPDGLYLAGENFISTHNTNAISIYSLWYAFTHSHSKILIVAPYQSQVQLIFQEIQMYIDQSEILSDSIEAQRNSPPITIIFKNGATLKGFASGKGQSQHSDQIRGQGANLIVLDEVDMMNNYDIETIMAIRASNKDCQVWASSTPRGWRKAFWEWCTKKNLRYREFHYISMEGPEWSQDSHDYYTQTTSKMGFTHEYLAEFGEEAFGVFKAADIDESLYDYKLSDVTPESVNGPLIMGVDWNLNAGTHITIMEWTGSMYRLVHKTVVPKSEFTQTDGVMRIKDLNKVWDPKFIYVDEGYGSAQIEMLKSAGLEDRSSRLYEKVVPIMMARTVKITDSKTGEEIQRQSKQFMVELTARRVEDHVIMLPREEDTDVVIEPDDPDNASVGLVQQMRNFRVVRESNVGQPIYSQEYEHTLTAMMLSILGFQMEFGGLTRTSYATTTAIGQRVGENREKVIGRAGRKDPLSKRPAMPRSESFGKTHHTPEIDRTGGMGKAYRIKPGGDSIVGGNAIRKREGHGSRFGKRAHRTRRRKIW